MSDDEPRDFFALTEQMVGGNWRAAIAYGLLAVADELRQIRLATQQQPGTVADIVARSGEYADRFEQAGQQPTDPLVWPGDQGPR